MIPPNTPPQAHPAGTPPPPRPPDVDTGFWLWLVALPLLVIGYVVDLVVPRVDGPAGSAVTYAVSGLFVGVLAVIVATFLFLMRAGYRWALTLLTGGGLASIVYVVSGLFTTDRSPVAAVADAGTGIVASVLIAGGVVLLHRADAHAYFTR